MPRRNGRRRTALVTIIVRTAYDVSFCPASFIATSGRTWLVRIVGIEFGN